MFFVLLLELHVPGYTIKIRKYFILLEENTKSVIVSLGYFTKMLLFIVYVNVTQKYYQVFLITSVVLSVVDFVFDTGYEQTKGKRLLSTKH